MIVSNSDKLFVSLKVIIFFKLNFNPGLIYLEIFEKFFRLHILKDLQNKIIKVLRE